ncbi:hypothetical protein GCK32_020040, partial [Trichostrongylus colubriformis]
MADKTPQLGFGSTVPKIYFLRLHVGRHSCEPDHYRADCRYEQDKEESASSPPIHPSCVRTECEFVLWLRRRTRDRWNIVK